MGQGAFAPMLQESFPSDGRTRLDSNDATFLSASIRRSQLINGFELVKIRSTIRLTFGSLREPKGSLMASHLHVECPE